MTDYLQAYIDLSTADKASIIDEMPYWAAKFAELFFEHLELRPNLTVLDLGTGTGVPLFELAHQHGKSCSFVGLDVWHAGLERANFKRGLYQLPNVSLVEYDGGKFPFLDSCFDLIVSNVGLNNFSNVDAILAECRRVAKLDARIAFTTNLVGHMKEFYSVFCAVLKDFDKPNDNYRLDANEAHRGTKEEHIATIEKAGFGIQKVVEKSLTWRYLNGSAMLRHSLTRFGFLDAWRAVLSSDESMIFTELEKRLNEIASTEGQLVMTIPQLYIEAVKI
jgi:arsenite methyltransferase